MSRAAPFSPLGGASFGAGAVVSSLRAKAMVVDGLIGEDDREAREWDDTYALRDRAVAEWSDAYQGTATALDGLYRRAGWKELAEKVRPTVRKMRGEGPDADEIETPKQENG